MTGRGERVTQAERVARHEILRTIIARLQAYLGELEAEQKKGLDGCEHTYADGRQAATGSATKVCAICGVVVKGRDDKLWG
jgi:hypothetical protein